MSSLQIEPAVGDSYGKVLDGSAAWAVYSVAGSSLKLQEASNEPLDELCDWFDEGKLMFAFCRVKEPVSVRYFTTIRNLILLCISSVSPGTSRVSVHLSSTSPWRFSCLYVIPSICASLRYSIFMHMCGVILGSRQVCLDNLVRRGRARFQKGRL